MAAFQGVAGRLGYPTGKSWPLVAAMTDWPEMARFPYLPEIAAWVAAVEALKSDAGADLPR